MGNYFYDNLVEQRGCYNPDEVMNNLKPEILSDFLMKMGIPVDQVKSLLIKTLAYVEDHQEDFDV